MGTMLGCASWAAVRASRRKRWRHAAFAANSGVRSLTATGRSSRNSRARYTNPMPPRPMGSRTSYRPARACRTTGRCDSDVAMSRDRSKETAIHCAHHPGSSWTPTASEAQIVPPMTRPAAPAAAPAVSGATYQPYISASQSPAELTVRAIVLGVVLGLIFGASNVYLALKIGLTVSASIPIAVLSITIFRWLGRSTILENNIVQTTGSAADSVSAGVVFTIPAILLMGYDLDISRVTILAIAGGLMGVLMMIPLRRALIVKEHGNLPYPEGTACAEVLIAGERGGIHAKTVFQAFGIAFGYKFLMTALKLWQEYPGKVIRSYQGAEVRVEASPELIGVGYIIGPRIAGYLFAGGCLAYVVLMPAIKLFGSAMTEPMFGTTKLIRDMSAGEIRAAFVFYIGAGAVASAG